MIKALDERLKNTVQRAIMNTRRAKERDCAPARIGFDIVSKNVLHATQMSSHANSHLTSEIVNDDIFHVRHYYSISLIFDKKIAFLLFKIYEKLRFSTYIRIYLSNTFIPNDLTFRTLYISIFKINYYNRKYLKISREKWNYRKLLTLKI